jgi:trimeric autotransporter adhesin
MRKSILSILAIILLISAKPAFSQWAAVGSGSNLNPVVQAISFYGTDLYAGGTFTTPVINLGKWNGSSWVALGSGLSSYVAVHALAEYSNYLYVGGNFGGAGGLGATSAYIARWNGTSWSTVGNGANGIVKCFTQIGSDLYVGGQFTAVNNTSGQVSNSGCIAKWNGTSSTWNAVGTGIGGSAAVVNAIASMGTDIYAGGNFTTAGGNPVTYVAKYNGSAWSALGNPGGPILCMAAFNGSLYAGGSFGVKKWNTSTSAWDPIGTLSGSQVVLAMTVYNGALTIGGYFTGVVGTPQTQYNARWNGTSWYTFNSTLGGDVATLYVRASNPSTLYMGGSFSNGVNGPYNSIAKYTTLVGTEEIIPASDISIYPNPAQDKFTVNLSSSLKSTRADLIIYNMVGTQVKELSIIKNQPADINCRELSAGIYFVKVIDGNRSFVQKMVVEW